MDQSRYLAIDIGAESGRAILGQFDGQRLALTEVQRFLNVPVRLPSGLHWDVLRLWGDITAAVRLAAGQGDQRLDSIGLDTWGVDFALLDRDGALIGNPHHYRDGRTDGMQEAAFQRMPREQIFERTGIQFMQINSLYQLLAMALGRSQALEQAQTFLTIPDLLNYWLTGRKVCEFSNATTTQCYDPRAQGWSGPLLAALGIRSADLPRGGGAGDGAWPAATRAGPGARRGRRAGGGAGLPRHWLGRGGGAGRGAGLRLDQLGHLVDHGHRGARAGDHAAEPGVQPDQRGAASMGPSAARRILWGCGWCRSAGAPGPRRGRSGRMPS